MNACMPSRASSPARRPPDMMPAALDSPHPLRAPAPPANAGIRFADPEQLTAHSADDRQ